MKALRTVLAQDVVLVSDGGPDHHAARRPVVGPDRVGRLLLNLAKRLPAKVSVRSLVANHQPALLAELAGRPVALLVLDVTDDHVSAIRVMINPAKLAGLSPFKGV